MNRREFTKLLGAERADAEYLPVACLLRSGRGCAGYYNTTLNQDLNDTCVLINARLVELGEAQNAGQRPAIYDFHEFLEEIVTNFYHSKEDTASPLESEVYGSSIPLMAISYDEIAVMYPVAHIGALMKRIEEEQDRIPTFLDFNRKSIVLKLLRTKLW